MNEEAPQSKSGHLLLQLEELHRAALRYAPVGVAHVALDGRWLWVNERLCSLLGYTEQELRGSCFQSITHQQDLSRDLEHVASLMCGEESRYAMEKRYIRKDQSVLWAKLSVTLLRDDSNAPLHFVAIIDDISEEKRLAEQLRLKTLQLEQRNRDLQGFTHSLAHELRGPLRSLIGYVEMLPECCPAPPTKEFSRGLGIIHHSALRMREMMDALLRLAEYGYRQLDKIDVDMTGLVREVLEFQLLERPSGSVDVSIGTLPRASVDRALFRHVWDNLLSNALKYTRLSEAPAIVIEGRNLGRSVEYAISDNGVGFDARYREDIFRPFQRVCGPGFEGLGVGLALVERVVQRHGGCVGADGRPGEGARVWFTLPLNGGAGVEEDGAPG